MTDPIDRPVTILLVEDNPGDARLAEEAFADAGLSRPLHVVRHGDEAIDFLRQRGDHAEAPRPDVVFLDWNLPGASGEDVLAEIKSTPALADVSVFVLLGSAVEAEIIEPGSHRPDEFVTKPIEPTDFVTVVQ